MKSIFSLFVCKKLCILPLAGLLILLIGVPQLTNVIPGPDARTTSQGD